MERWDLYTKDRVKTGMTVARGDEIEKGLYRIVVHVCIFNSQNQMLIQQRQLSKKSRAGMWDLSVGGHVIAGETSQEAIAREVKEEIGLDVQFDRPYLTVNFENGFNDIYVWNQDIEIDKLVLQEEEVMDVRWATLEEINEMKAQGLFIPYHDGFLEFMFAMRNDPGTRSATKSR